MKLYPYFIFFLLTLVCRTGAQAQTVHKPYNPYWQWGYSDSARSFRTPGGTVLAVKNGKALWGRMSANKRSSLAGAPEGSWVLNEFDSLGRVIANSNTTIQGNVQLYAAQADAAGNWYVLGRWYDTVLFSVNQPYTRANPASNTDADHFIVRYNAGTMFPSWITIIGPFSDQSSRSFVVDNNRLLLAVDTLNGTLVRSVNTTTGAISTLFKQTGASTSSSIQVDAAGAIYLAGACAQGGMNFNGATESASVTPHSYIVKYRANGTHIWHHWFRDNSCHQRKLTLFDNKTLYYSGNMSDSFTLGNLPLQPTVTNLDYVAARMDTSGRVFWARQLPLGSTIGIVQPGAPYHATVTPDSSLTLFAQGAGYVNWEDTLVSNFQAVSAASVVSIGYDGHTRWVRDVYTDVVMNQHIASEGNAVWISGYANSKSAAIAMDTMRTQTRANQYSPFMARTRLFRPIPTAPPIVGVGGMEIGSFRAFPVPAHSSITLEGMKAADRISLIDIAGRRVLEQTATGSGRMTLDVAHLPRGSYVLQLREADGAQTTSRITLQ